MIKTIIVFVLIVPGLALFYAMILRPLLHKIPQFKQFYTEADGFWEKVWALCGNSLTIMWGYLLAGFGSSLEVLDWAAAAFGDPDMNLKQHIMDTLKDYPNLTAYALMIISGITIASRLRSIIRGS